MSSASTTVNEDPRAAISFSSTHAPACNDNNIQPPVCSDNTAGDYITVDDILEADDDRDGQEATLKEPEDL